MTEEEEQTAALLAAALHYLFPLASIDIYVADVRCATPRTPSLFSPKWLRHNDADISSVSPDRVLGNSPGGGQAHVLLYMREGT